MKKIIIIILSTFLLTGCFNYTELNKMAIVSSIGIDRKSDKYEVTVQIMNAKESDETEGSQVSVYTEKGTTIMEALRKISLRSPRKLNGSHLSKLVLSKEVSKENIIDILDAFERMSNVKDDFNIVIVDNISAKNSVKILTTTQNIPAEYVRQTLDSGYINTGLTYSTKSDEFISNHLKKYVDPVLPVLKIENYKEKGTTTDNLNTTDPITKIKIMEKLAITKNSKVIDYLNKDEVLGYNFLNNKINDAVISVKCSDNNYSSISLKNKTKYKVKKEKNKYILTFNITSTGQINEYTCKKDLKKNKNIKELENNAKKEIKKYIKKVINKQSKSNSNFLGIKRKVYLRYSKYNNEDIDIKYNIKVNINKKGHLNNSIKDGKYE
ncbi:MAG: Ger(x)C family spore germination protein [Bacilli bacterium]|nr:Ger(x)C family spore germination protein [Bacilli bacterium]